MGVRCNCERWKDKYEEGELKVQKYFNWTGGIWFKQGHNVENVRQISYFVCGRTPDTSHLTFPGASFSHLKFVLIKTGSSTAAFLDCFIFPESFFLTLKKMYVFLGCRLRMFIEELEYDYHLCSLATLTSVKYKFKTWLTSSHTYNVKSEGRRPTDWVKVAFLFFLVQISHFCFALSVLLLTMKWLLTFPFALLSSIHSLEINMAREVWQWTTKDWALPFFKDILLTSRWSFMFYFHTLLLSYTGPFFSDLPGLSVTRQQRNLLFTLTEEIHIFMSQKTSVTWLLFMSKVLLERRYSFMSLHILYYRDLSQMYWKNNTSWEY